MRKSPVWLVVSVMAPFALAACAPLPAPRPGAFESGSAVDPSQIIGSSSDEHVTPPRLISGDAPVYPIQKDRRGVEGGAVIRFIVATDGTTRDFEVLSADSQFFASHAIHALKEWRFEPAKKSGQIVEMRVVVPFSYKQPE